MSEVTIPLKLEHLAVVKPLLDEIRPDVQYTVRNTWSPGSSGPTGQELVLDEVDMDRVLKYITSAAYNLLSAELQFQLAGDKHKTKINEDSSRIVANYDLEHGGPNPYYKCRRCGDVIPGLREYLLDHLDEGKSPGNRKCPAR